ncbi:YopX family protein [Streptococcus pneumoniae]|uniref:YopX family protein n=1 Tax=Streptococcus pneumoniae TaxID=1313 RepID=UPI00061CD73D|nr:putative prophage protein [Streptococcus pneumoniae]
MIPRYRAWHLELGRMMLIKNMWFQDGSVEELELNDAVMNDYITVCPDEIELMQTTGLCDKEGTEVFEGDILHHQIQTEYTFIVKYDKEKGRWYGDGLSRTYRIDIAKRFLPYYKVIGNIYENQEILKEKE